MRHEIVLSIHFLHEADTPYLFLTFDSIMSRNRDLLAKYPDLAVALSRLVVQLGYRFASERYKVEDGYATLTIELTKNETTTLCRFKKQLVFNIEAQERYWKNVLTSGRAKNKSAVEARIAGLKLLKQVIVQICEA